MKFPAPSAAELLGEMKHIPASAADATSARVVGRISVVISRLRGVDDTRIRDEAATILGEGHGDLDVFRLFTGDSQDVVAAKLAEHLKGKGTYQQFRRRAKDLPDQYAEALDAIGVIGAVREHLRRTWDLADILGERYRMSRGRAVAGQSRGRALEDAVQAILDGDDVPYVRGQSFTGSDGIVEILADDQEVPEV